MTPPTTALPRRPAPALRETDAVRTAALAALAIVVCAGLWLRLRAAPGPWGTDALGYAERALGGGEGAPDTRSQRVVFLHVVRAALGLGHADPLAASVPGIALSAIVGPVLFAALRPRIGSWFALLPAVLWAVLGLDVEETVELSADAATALPGAVVVLALARAQADPARALRWIVAGGAAAAAGFLLKETAAFAGAGLVAGAFVIGRGSERGRLVAAAVLAIATVLAVGAACGLLTSPGVVSHEMSWAPAAIRPGNPRFLARLTTDVPVMLVTATGAFGVMHAAALPCFARFAFRAVRGDGIAAAAVVGLVAFAVTPISFASWALLPATFPRYVLGVMPLVVAAIGATLADAPATRGERVAGWIGAALSLPFLGHGAVEDASIVLAAVASAAATLPFGSRDPRSRWTVPARAAWAAALVAGALCWLDTPHARTRPDPVWTAWGELPATGAIVAQRPLGRRLAIAARSVPTADASRLRLWDETPPEAAPGDLVISLGAVEGRNDLVPAGIPDRPGFVVRRVTR